MKLGMNIDAIGGHPFVIHFNLQSSVTT